MPSVLSLSPGEARTYFLEEKNYVNFDLPPYVTFQEMLNKLALEIGDSPLSSYFRVPDSSEEIGTKTLNPKDFEGVNYKLLSNKDGNFAWRPFEVIHPALYVALVHDMTSHESWQLLCDLFGKYQKSVVLCESIPYQSDDEESHKAHQVRRWWSNVEQASLRLALRFQYVFDADVTDCYGSIYTHSIAWAIHGKDFMKQGQNRSKTELLGNRIDWLIEKMRHGQTNGIPQGSTLMDFVAEIVLGHVDLLLTEKLKEIPKDDFSIIRYRDDYKVFTNRPDLGHKIIKELSEILSSMGMRLNTQKTRVLDDPVLASIKEDKRYELFVPRNPMSMSKWLVQIYSAAEKYPNSGMLTRQLDKYFKALDKARKKGKYDDLSVMISIVVNIAIKNPRSYPWCMAIISKLISFYEGAEGLGVIIQIRDRFEAVPNTGLLDIWLQRVSYKMDPNITYDEMITKIVSGAYLTNLIWKSTWLKQNIHDIVSNTPIINWKTLESMDPIITKEEVALFNPLVLS